MQRAADIAGRVGFCPFCRESFENIASCPEHELALVAWQDLPPDPLAPELPIDETAVMSFGFDYGRIWIYLGALCLLIGFFMDAFAVSLSQVASPSAFELANSRAVNLWTIPLCALVAVAVCYRRRTLVKMRSARLALVVVASMPLVSMTFTFFGVRRWLGPDRALSLLEPRAGLYVLGLGVILLLFGAARFGTTAPR